MAKGSSARPGAAWRPTPAKRVAGRTRHFMPRIRLPSIRVPRLPSYWQRVAISGAFIAALAVAGWWIYNSPLLSIQDVEIEGNSVVSSERARTVADLEGQSIIQADLDGARERLLSLILVKNVEISRNWPNGVTITLTERTPWGLWQLGNTRHVIDEEGVVLDLPAPAAAPLIIQTDASVAALNVGDQVDAGAMAVVTQLVATAQQTLNRSVRSLEFSQAEGLTAFFTSSFGGPDLRVVFGDAQGYDFKIASLFAVLAQAEQQGRVLSRVDLRFGERVAVQ